MLCPIVHVWSGDKGYGQGGSMKGIFDRVGLFVENSVDLKGSPEVVGLRSGSVEGWGLFPS